MAEFMVVLRGGDPELKRYSPADVQKIMDRYYRWVDGLKKNDRYRGGSPFKEGSKVLSGHKEFVMIQEGTFLQREEALTGYFIIEASGISEAVEVAKTCPALTHGESVEVLQLDNHP